MTNRLLTGIFITSTIFGVGCGSDAAQTGRASAPNLVAHRGASAYAPEHSIEAYELAIQQGADYIEPDLQITRDGVLIALHDLTLERTTNVSDVFPNRSRQEEIDGTPTTVWLANDFTLDEIRQLDAGSWFSDEFADTKILSLSEVIEAVRGRAGLFIETKAPEFYDNLGFDMGAMLLAELARHGLDTPGADPATPILIQSFNPASLERLRNEHNTQLSLTLLIGGEQAAAEWLTSDGLMRAAEFVTGIGPAKNLLLDNPQVMDLAHQHGLAVVPWTFRSDRPGDFDDVETEMAHYLDVLGVDGIITNNPDLFPRASVRGGS